MPICIIMTIQIITCTNILYKLDLKYFWILSEEINHAKEYAVLSANLWVQHENNFTLHVLYIVRLYDFSLKNMTNRRLYIINQLELYNFFFRHVNCRVALRLKLTYHDNDYGHQADSIKKVYSFRHILPFLKVILVHVLVLHQK